MQLKLSRNNERRKPAASNSVKRISEKIFTNLQVTYFEWIAKRSGRQAGDV